MNSEIAKRFMRIFKRKFLNSQPEADCCIGIMQGLIDLVNIDADIIDFIYSFMKILASKMFLKGIVLCIDR